MPISQTHITWNKRLNAWDKQTIEALQERLVRSSAIPQELAEIFSWTMQWGETHPFDADITNTLLGCWSMMVLGSNIPWKDYDDKSGNGFLPSIVKSDPAGVLNYLSIRVHARLKDRVDSVAWIAQALHVARHLDADVVAPVLEALAKTWSGDIKRSQDFAQALGEHAVIFPWNDMHVLHTKFHAYPHIQKAIFQWDGLCTAERVFQASSIDVGFGSSTQIFASQGEASAFHAHTLALNMSGMHLARRWGVSFLATAQEELDNIPVQAKRAMETTWKMLRETATQSVVACDRALMQKAAGWCMDHVPVEQRIIRYEKADAILLGDKPYFTQAIDGYLALHAQKNEHVGALILDVLTHADPVVQDKYRPFLSASAKDYLLDFMERGGNAITSSESIPLLISYLSSDDVVGLSQTPGVNEQRLFWKIVEQPEHFNEHTRRNLVQTSAVKNAILLITLLESHGVEHWNIAPDHNNVWARTLPLWYPDAMPQWEHVLRESLRWPATARSVLLDAVFDVQEVPRQRWDAIQHMVDAPAPNKDARQAMSNVRNWNLGLPQSGMGMAWVLDALHACPQAGASFPLPVLDELAF